jgi:hypothetical protein
MTAPNATPPLPPAPPLSRVIAIGCVMAWIGGLSGAMIAVLVAKVVAYATRAPSCDGIPTCDWYIYAAVGASIGALSLPWLVVSALRRPPAPPVTPEEPNKN